MIKRTHLILPVSFFFLFAILFTLSASDYYDHVTLRVGVYNNRPKIFVDKDGKPAGIFIDVLEAISAKENFSIEYVIANWTELIEMLATGQIDIVPDMAYSAKRDSLFNFNKLSVISTWLEIYTSKSTPVSLLTDLQDKRVGVLKDSYQEELLNNKIKSDFKLSFETIPFDDYESKKNALIKGEVDVIVADRFFYFTSAFDSNIVPTGVVFQPNELFYGFSNHISHELLKIFDHNISRLKNNPDSEFFISMHKWLDSNKHEHGIPTYIIWIIVIISAVTILAFIFILLLRNSVRLKTRELQVAKDKAEESDHLKTVFLQNISHEIRTPMNGILGFIDLLDNDILMEEDKKKYYSIVRKSGERLINTLNDVIDISKIESNQISLHFSEINIDQFLSGLFQFFNKQAEDKGLKFSLDAGQLEVNASPNIIKTDKSLLEKILINLLKNALKFTAEGSISFGYRIKHKFLEFYVKDSGCGIPSDRQSAIYDRFVQSDLKITRAHEGSGIGLAISRAYVEMLGGKIWVESEVDKGSVFYFTIPYLAVNQREQPNAKQTTSLDSLSQPLTILIAEDDEISYLYLENILNNDKITLIRTVDGIETVDTLKSNPHIQLILLDIKLPGISGIEVAKRIRKFNRSIPIIAQTAYAFAEEKVKIMKAGCNDVISKPVKREELIGKMLKILS
jgi:signal transduction histidine kinase